MNDINLKSQKIKKLIKSSIVYKDDINLKSRDKKLIESSIVYKDYKNIDLIVVFFMIS